MLVNEKIKSKVQIKELSNMKVASFRVISVNPEIDATLYVKEKFRKTTLNINNLRKFGVDIPVSEKEQEKGLRGYECWVCLPDDVNHIEGLFIKTIPIGNYAVLRIYYPKERPIDKISNGWIELHNWVKSSGYKSALHNPNKYMLEEMIKIDGVSYLDLFYPVCLFEWAN